MVGWWTLLEDGGVRGYCVDSISDLTVHLFLVDLTIIEHLLTVGDMRLSPTLELATLLIATYSLEHVV